MCQCWLLVSLDVGETAMPTRCFSVPALLVEVNCINVFLEGRKASLVRSFFFNSTEIFGAGRCWSGYIRVCVCMCEQQGGY